MKILVGTRGSRLAISQTNIVINALKKSNPSIDFEVVIISTKGDSDPRPLFTIDQKGIFEKEVNEAVLDRRVDFAVHSLKDVPSDLSEFLIVACIPRRASPNDVLVNDKKIKLRDLASGSIVGTSSLRRAIQVMKLRPDLVVRPIRGNVETRVKKAIRGEYDAVVLAEAGLGRLGLTDVVSEKFSIKDFVPAPGQGAIAVVCRRNDTKIISILHTIDDERSRLEITAERALLTKIEGGCRFPVGAVAVADIQKQKLTLYASVFSADGSESIKLKQTSNLKNPEKLGIKVANMLISKGAMKFALGWRDAVMEWNSRL